MQQCECEPPHPGEKHATEHPEYPERQGGRSEGRPGNGESEGRLGGGNLIPSIVTVEAAQDLGGKVGDEVRVLIKATSIMIGKG
ncbi:MAG TPA: TOBE domain-containing protein [Syntrophobacteraceae bacterium]|nr:TOBE domain-containing protein [Syntrophobacteraceae bacterium]